MDLQDIKLLRSGIKHLIESGEHGLRDKQVEAFRALVSDEFTDKQISHSYFKLPTGFGKTVMFAKMARAYFDAVKAAGAKPQKIIIIVPRLSLIGQTKKDLDEFAGLVATEFSGRRKDNKSDVIITTYNSLATLFSRVDYDSVGLIFADEAHHMLGKMISDKLTKFNKYVPIIGFTATPEYESNRAVADMLNTEIFAKSIPECIEGGILSPVKNVLYRSSIICDLSAVPSSTNGDIDYDKIIEKTKKTKKDGDETDAFPKISPDTLATEIARIYAEGVDADTGIEFRNLKAIVNCPNAEIADIQAAKINKVMGRKVAISLHKVGISDKEYDRLKGDFESGRYTVACQVGTLTEGFDDVTVSMCINYPTRSRVKAEQTAGRAIRIDKNNPNKIAFVVDTIFRGKPDQTTEDILYTVSNSKQVLFKDIVEGMVFIPGGGGGRGGGGRGPVTFADFELITDSATLMELNRNVKERIANETLKEKTEEWLSAFDLVKDKDFPSSDFKKINAILNALEHDPEFAGYIQDMKSGSKVAKCLHISKKQAFAQRAGFKAYPEKTAEWLSAIDLMKNKDFPSGDNVKINKLLSLLEHDPEFEGYIQTMKSRSQVAKCLHVSKKQAFAQRAGFKAYPKKTAEWLSARDLIKDKDFPSGQEVNINKALNELEHVAEFVGYIQDMKCGSMVAKCLHVSKKQAFAQRAGFKAYPKKTAEWLSALDLVKDRDFPSRHPTKINAILKELEHDPEFAGYIQDMKCSGLVAKCLHSSKKQAFAQRAGFKASPEKTAEWLSAYDLMKDKDFPSGTARIINKALNELEHSPEFEGYIQDMKGGGRAAKCLHISKKHAFARRAGFKAYPEKTTEWLSALDLVKDKDFPSAHPKKINTILNELEHDSEFEEYIKDMKSGTQVVKCLHVGKKQAFAQRTGFEARKTKSMKKAATGVAAVNNIIETSNAVKSNADPDTHQK